jgi:hypothetical protein
MDSLQSMINTVRRAKFGGPANRLTVGTDVWEVMQKSDEIKAQLDKNYNYMKASTLNLGLREGNEAEYVGNLSQNLQIWVYNDYYEAEDGTQTAFMNSKDIVLTGSNVLGIRAYGAIQDIKAGLKATPMYPKMWDEEDPSATIIMTQSAPLMVPVNPNATLKATVVA